MNKNKKVLLKIFDIDDEIVEDVYIETDNNNTVYIKLKRTIECCPNCGSIKLLSKGFYKSKFVGYPFNGKPTYIVCKIRKYMCKAVMLFLLILTLSHIKMPI